MKIIETVIVYEDYNYVEGNLELKFSGVSLSENNDEFSVDMILSTKLFVTERYIAPNIPKGINRDRVFALQLPHNIPTYANDNGKQIAFNAVFDKIICDDRFVTKKGTLIINRFNTIKDEGKLFSTFNVTVYGLKKNKREEIESVSFYELFPSIVGDGKIKIIPKKEYYAIGEKVSVKALPNKNAHFIKWNKDFEDFNTEQITFEIEKDVSFEAVFTEFQNVETTQLDTLLNNIKKTYNSSSLKSKKQTNDYFEKSKFENNYFENDKLGNKKEEKENVGCLGSLFEGFGILLQAIGYIIFGVFAVSLLIAIINGFGWHSLWIIGFFLSLWLLPKVFNVLGRLKVLGYLFNLLFIGIVILSLVNLVSVFSSNGGVKTPSPKPKKIPTTIEKVKENTSIDYVHFIEWEDSNKEKYSTYLKVNSDYVTYETNVKQSFPSLRTEQDYNRLLSNLYSESEESLYFVYKSLDSLKTKNGISNQKFPDVVVSMIQSIPYYAILDSSCSPYDYQDQYLRELLQNNPCQGYIKHGIKSPAEFLKDLKADCDSRTLLLYTVLKHYNYDVAIFGSEYYKHSILGINSPNKTEGLTYKEYNGKRYYLWETTNVGFTMGNISNTMRNTNYWSINLN